MPEPEPVQRLLHPPRALLGRHAAQPQRVGDVLRHRLVRPERVGLEDEPEPAPLRRQLDVPPGVEAAPGRRSRSGPCRAARARRRSAGAWSCRCPRARAGPRSRPVPPGTRRSFSISIAAEPDGQVVDDEIRHGGGTPRRSATASPSAIIATLTTESAETRSTAPVPQRETMQRADHLGPGAEQVDAGRVLAHEDQEHRAARPPPCRFGPAAA